MRSCLVIAIVVVLLGCSKGPDESARTDAEPAGTSKLGAALNQGPEPAPSSADIPDFSAQDPLSPERWKPALGSAIPVAADAVTIAREGAVLQLATQLKAGRTDFDYTQPIPGDFVLTLRVSATSVMSAGAPGRQGTNAFFQVHPPNDRFRSLAAPIHLPAPNSTVVIQVMRSGDEVRCLCDNEYRGGRTLAGPLQFGLWLNGVGQVDVHDFTLEEVTPQLAARIPSGASGGFGNAGAAVGGAPPPGFAGGPPGFGPGPPNGLGGFGGPPPGMQGGFGGQPPALQSGFSSPPPASGVGGDTTGAGSFSNSPPTTAAIPVSPDPLLTETVGEPLTTYPLPAPVAKVVVAGGGKYLLLHFRQIAKLGLYDVEQGRLTRLISLRGNPFIAAGAEQFVIINDKTGAMVRLRLSDSGVDARGQLPQDFQLLDIAMGAASAGPALMAVAGEGGGVSAMLLDLHSLAPIQLRGGAAFGADWTRGAPLRASAGGQVFGVSGRPARLIVANGSEVTEQTHTGFTTLLPDPLGQTVFTDKGLCNTQLRPVAEIGQTTPAIPAATGPFFLSVGVSSLAGRQEPAGPVALHVLPSGDKIADFSDLVVATNPTTFRSGDLQIDQRLVLHPASGTIVALGESNDKLLVKRFNLKRLLDQTKPEYLLVTSHPRPAVKAGEVYRYQLGVLAKGGDIDYELASGPEGMVVSSGGLVSWTPNTAQEGALQHVVMSVRQAGGESVFHTFAVQVVGDSKLATRTAAAAPPTPSRPPATASTSPPMAANSELPNSSSPPGYGDATVASPPPPKYLSPRVFGFDIPAGETTVPEDQRVTTTDESGKGVVAKLYADIGDNRIVMLPNGKLVTKSKDESPLTERPFRAATKKQVTDELQSRFPSFTRNATRHFSYVYNTSPNFYKGTSRILETMLPGLRKFAQAQGIKTHDPKVPLVVIMFLTEAQFKLYGAPEGAAAYYDIQSNEIVMYEQSPMWKVDPELAFKDTIATIAHEGAHQILANIGVQKRLSMWPMWLTEGLAEYLSPTSFGRDLRWKGAGATHDLRMSDLELYFKLRGLEETDATLITYTVGAYRLSSFKYAAAWSLTHFLADNHKQAFAAHLREASQRGPLETPGDLLESNVIPQNLTLFTKHFGDDLAALEKQLIEHLKSLPYDPPYADRPHYVAMLEWQESGKRKREANIFRISVLAQKWLSDKRKVLTAEGIPRATVSVRQYANRPLAERDARQFLGR